MISAFNERKLERGISHFIFEGDKTSPYIVVIGNWPEGSCTAHIVLLETKPVPFTMNVSPPVNDPADKDTRPCIDGIKAYENTWPSADSCTSLRTDNWT
jgi:hypothetical protein